MDGFRRVISTLILLASLAIGGGAAHALDNISPASPKFILAPGFHDMSLKSGSVDRPFIFYVPASYDGSKALPLVLVLHGMGGSAKSMVLSTKLNLLADQENFFVAYLNGTGDPRGWNSGLTPELNFAVDDVAFVRGLVNYLDTQVPVDNYRVYATGFSNGGFMTHRLGAELSDVLAGIAVVEGIIGNYQPDGTLLKIATPMGPIPVLILHGLEDHNAPYYGGHGVNPAMNALSVSDAVQFWKTADGCSSNAIRSVSPDNNALTASYQDCTGENEVTLITLVTGEHEWPTLQNHAHFDGSTVVWQFFSQHARKAKVMTPGREIQPVKTIQSVN